MTTIIKSSQLSLVPTRDKFLDPALVAVTANTINKQQQILFMVNDLFESKPYERDYAIYISGVFACGSRAVIKLCNLAIYTDVMVPDNIDEMQFKLQIGHILGLNGAQQYCNPETIALKRMDRFEEYPRAWHRYYFNSIKDRRAFIAAIERYNRDGGGNIVCGSNDSDYLHLVARTWNFPTADWAKVTKYNAMDKSTVVGLNENIKYYLHVDVRNFKRLTKADKLEMKNSPLASQYDRDLSLVCSWDIETYFQHESGRPPRKEDVGWKIHMVCMSFFWHWSDKPLLEICVTDRQITQSEEAAREGRNIDIIIECRSDGDLVATCAHVWGAMGPEILSAYNGVGFDTPLLSELAYITKNNEDENNLIFLAKKLSAIYSKTTPDNILKWNYMNDRPVKVGADNNLTVTRSSLFPGLIDTDVMISFMKLNSKGEVSLTKGLNFFLAENGLPSKEDMEYKTMFRIFERSYQLEAAPDKCHCGDTSKTADCPACKSYMREIDIVGDKNITCDSNNCCYCTKLKKCQMLMFDVAYYCKIDCLRPQQLCVKRSIFADKRALANMARVRVWTAYYQADGMKVQNLIGKYANKFGYAFNNGRISKSDHDKDHNPGAYVFKPKLGLHSWVPIFAVDASSLYPSIMMEFNLSPDKIVEDEVQARELALRGYVLHQIGPIRYERGEKKGAAGNTWHVLKAWSVRHGGIKRADKQKNIVVAYEKIETSKEGEARNIWYPKDKRLVINGEFAGPTAEEMCRCACLYKKLEEMQQPIREELAPELLNITCDYDHQRGIMHAGHFTGDPSRRFSYKEVYGRSALPGEVMGVLPYICSMLFNKRVPVKFEWNKWKQIVEKMKLEGAQIYEEKLTNGSIKQHTLADAIFNINKYDSTQKAIKILNNTFYGQSSNFRSPTYKFAVGSGITSAGQTTIKRVADRIHSLGGIVWYGDTDSAYNSAPITLLAPAYIKYARELSEIIPENVERPPIPDITADNLTEVTQAWSRFPIGPEHIHLRVKLWTEMVAASMNYAKVLCEDLGDMLMLENGGRFLQFAYEEVGMPTMLLGKKKYAMCAHIKEIKFDITKDIGAEGLFIKGLDIVKQGVTPIAKEMGVDLVHEALTPQNNLTLMQLAEKYLIKFMESELDANVLAKMQKYKPDRKNVAVHTFVARMKAMHSAHANDSYMRSLYEPPEPGDKFASVIVESTDNYQINGNIKRASVGDRTEYLHVFLESQKWNNPYKLDRMYYLEKSIMKLLTRFIHYPAEFQPPADMFDMDAQYDQYDRHVSAAAEKHLLAVASRYLPRFNIAASARVYKQQYRDMTKRADAAASMMLPRADILQIAPKVGGVKALIDALIEDRGKIVLADDYINDYCRKIIRGLGWGQQKIYSYYVATRPRMRSVTLIRRDHYNRMLARIMLQINEYATAVIIMKQQYDERLAAVIVAQRKNPDAVPDSIIENVVKFTDEQKDALEKLNSLVNQFVATLFASKCNRAMIDLITSMNKYAREPIISAADNYSDARAKFMLE